MNVYIHPGEYHFSTKEETIQTVLGSCLTVIMRCERLHIAAFSHAQLPISPENEKQNTEAFRYVDSAIRAMYAQFAKYKISNSEIEVKIIGGGDVLELVSREKATVGRQNIESALKTLEELKLSITAMDIGGPHGRKVLYYTGSGLVRVARIKKVLMAGEA